MFVVHHEISRLQNTLFSLDSKTIFCKKYQYIFMYTIKYIKLAPTFKYMYRKVSVKVNSKIQLNGHDQSGVVMCYAYILFLLICIF